MQVPRITRRSIVRMGLAVAALSTPACCTRKERRWRFFTAEEARTVDAICEQLIPGDHHPGAREARVVNYIDAQLARTFRRYRKAYREGINAVNTASGAKFKNVFTALTSEQQTEVLQEIEENSKAFFDLILNHTRQGFYGDPRHGGNHNWASWKMVGLPFPPVRGRQVV